MQIVYGFAHETSMVSAAAHEHGDSRYYHREGCLEAPASTYMAGWGLVPVTWENGRAYVTMGVFWVTTLTKVGLRSNRKRPPGAAGG